jgi:hypothetical protein
MKIYTELLMDMNGNVIHEESFEYDGAICELKGSDNEVKETAQEREIATISKEQWNQYQTRFKPFEDEWISNIKTDAGDQELMAGQVASGVSDEYDKQAGAEQQQQFSAGMDPSSGAYKAAMSGLSRDRGADTGKAQAIAGQAVDDQTYQGLQQAISMGRGQAAEATRDMTTLAYDATGKAISDRKNKNDTTQSWVSSGMSLAGAGLAGWSNRKKSNLLPVSQLQANGEQ